MAATDLLNRLRARGVVEPAPGPGPGVKIHLHKRMPLASGLGSSAASSVAAAIAVNELYGRPFTPRELLLSAVEGERVASGSPHADNAAPCLLGGIVLVRTYEPLDVLELPVPPDLWVVVVHPHCSIRTGEARAMVFERRYSLPECVANLGNLGAFVGALYRGDLQLVGRCISDQLVEPIRARLIPGFFAVKEAALAAGALGCSISGSGPSVFALSDQRGDRPAGCRRHGRGVPDGRAASQRRVRRPRQHRGRPRRRLTPIPDPCSQLVALPCCSKAPATQSPAVTFREALVRGLAPDGGLYLPAAFPAPRARRD